MSQFGSFDPESQFDTTQDIPFDAQYPLSPDTSAAMDAGSYDFQPAQPEEPPLEGLRLPSVRVGMPAYSEQDLAALSEVQLPTTARNLPGLPSQETMDALQRRQQEPTDLMFEPSNVDIRWEEANKVVAPEFGSFDQQDNYKAIDALWDQLSGAEDQRKQQNWEQFGITDEAPLTPEQISPKRSEEVLAAGVARSNEMQGVNEWRFLWAPIYTINEGFDTVLERRNVQNALRRGDVNSPDVQRYVNNLKFGEQPGAFDAAMDALKQGTLDVAMLPQSLFVNLPAAALSWATDGSIGQGVLEEAANFARWRTNLQENSIKADSVTGQFTLDVLRAAPQVVAQLAAAFATGGGSALATAATRTAVYAGLGAGQSVSNQFFDSLDAELKAGTPMNLAGQRAMRDAFVSGSITGATEALLGAFGTGYSLLKPATVATARRAIADTQLKTYLRGAARGWLKESSQETLDQFGSDFVVNMFRRNEEQFKEFYAQNPDWVTSVIKNSLYAGLVGGVLGVPTGVATEVSDKNRFGRFIGGLDRIIGALPDNDPRIRMLQRDTLTPDEAVTVVKWLADQDQKLMKATAADIKMEKTLGAALDMDSMGDLDLMSIIVAGPDAAKTARLRGAPDEDVGKFGNVDFVVTPTMAADELARREIVKGRTAEGARTATFAAEGAMEINPSTEYQVDKTEEFVRDNPVLAERLASMSEPISRKMMEQLTGKPFVGNNVEFRTLAKQRIQEEVQRQQADRATLPTRLQEAVDNSRRKARTDAIAALTGLSEDEVARVALGVSPARARMVSKILAEASADQVYGPQTVEQITGRADAREAASAIQRQQRARAGDTANILQQWESGEFVRAKFARDAERKYREKFDRYAADLRLYERTEMVNIVADEMIEAINAVMEAGTDDATALVDFNEAVAMVAYMSSLNPSIARDIEAKVDAAVGDARMQVSARLSGMMGADPSAATINAAARERAKERATKIVEDAKRRAVYALDRDELKAKEDPNYIVTRARAIDILAADMDDQTREDLATLIGAGTGLGVEMQQYFEGQLALDELPAAREGANVEQATARILGRIDMIRRTGEGMEKAPQRPGFAAETDARIAELTEAQGSLREDLDALRKEKAKIERELQPLLEDAWLTKPKGKKPAKRRKKRLPATDAEKRLETQLRNIDEQIARISGQIDENGRKIGIERVEVAEPRNVNPTATFRDANARKRAEDIAAVRLNIAALNGIDASEVEVRYDDGETTLSSSEKALTNFGNQLGVTVVIMKTPEGTSTAGAYSNGVVYIDYRDVDRPSAWFSIALHETMHHLADTNPQFFSSLYKDLNRKVPKALKAIRAVYSNRLDMQARVASVRRAGLVMLNDESDQFTDALLWLVRNDPSSEFAMLRANMPEQIANALDSQDLASVVAPSNDTLADAKKKFNSEMRKADRAAVTEDLLKEEEVATLAQMLMDTTFVSIIDERGQLDFEEVKRLAKTAKSTGLLARLSAGIADAFFAIPMPKKLRGLNEVQAAKLREFADNPKELNNPRARQAAQSMIAKAIMKMMEAKRGQIPMAGIPAKPMSEAAAAERIPALRQSIRSATAAVEPEEPSRSRESFDALLRQAIRSAASLSKPREISGTATNMFRKGVTPIRLLEDANGNKWVFKWTDTNTNMMNNEIFANLMAERLGSPAFMPEWARVTMRDVDEDGPNAQPKVQLGSITPLQPGVVLANEENSATFDSIARTLPAVVVLSVGDLHSGNLTRFFKPIDYGDSVIHHAMGGFRRMEIWPAFDPDAAITRKSEFMREVSRSMSGPAKDTDGDLFHPRRVFDVAVKQGDNFDYSLVRPGTMMMGIPQRVTRYLMKQYAAKRIDAKTDEDIQNARVDMAYDMLMSVMVGSFPRTGLGKNDITVGDRPFEKNEQPTRDGLRRLVGDLSQIAEDFYNNDTDIDDALEAAGVGDDITEEDKKNLLREAIKTTLLDRSRGFLNTMESILDLLNPNVADAIIDDDEVVESALIAEATSNMEFKVSPSDKAQIDQRVASMYRPAKAMSSIKQSISPEESLMTAEPDAKTVQVRQAIRHINARSTVDIMQAATDDDARRLAGVNTEKPARGSVYNKVRDIGLALSRRTMRANLEIAPGDNTPETIDALAEIVADEVQWNLGADAETGSGVGWYSKNWPEAVKKLGAVFPELRTSREARDVFSALVAIMSNGARVRDNMKSAIDAYAAYRSGRKLSSIRVRNRRGKAMVAKLHVMEELIAKYGHSGFRRHMLTKTTVADMNARLREAGERTNADYLASTIVPRSSAYFGPKLGMFFANLMGGKDYLTMDMWWTRSINRMRGLLEPQPTESSLTRFRELLGADAPKTKYDLMEMAEEIREAYQERNYRSELEELMGRKEGTKKAEKERFHAAARKRFGTRKYNRLFQQHSLEKTANSIAKAAFDTLEEAPFNASDRKFMIDIAKSAQDKLAARGVKLSISDLQAALWYYEKRLYDRLRGGGKEDIGYDEAALEWVEANRNRSQRPSVRFGQQVGGRSGAAGAGPETRQLVRRGSAERPVAGRRVRIAQSLRASESNYQPANLAAAEVSMRQALASREEIGGRLERLGAAWLGTARQLASRFVPNTLIETDDEDISVINKPADISPFWKFVAAPLNLAIGSGNADVVGVVEDMIDMDMERNMLTQSRQQEAEAVWNSIPAQERNEQEFAQYMDEFHAPDTIDSDPEFAGKSQQWRDALKWFKTREEVRRQEIVDIKREAILGMLKRDNSARIVRRAAENGKSWSVVRRPDGRKAIQTEDGIVSIPESRQILSKIMMPDSWGRQYAHFYHWFNGEYKLAGYNADGTRDIIGSAMTEPEAYERLYAFKKANPGRYVRYTAEPAVQINPDELVRMSDAQRRRLERMLSDATGAYRDDVADAMRGIVGSRTSKRPFYAPLMERTGAKGFETDFMRVWNLSERLHNRWAMGGRMVRELNPRIEKIRRDTPGWGDYLAESMRHTLYTAPTSMEAAMDSMIRAIPVVGKMVGPFATRRLLGSLRALNYGRQLLTVRQQVVNSFQPLQTIYPILGEKGLMEAIAFYNSEEGKEVLKRYGHFDAAGRFKEGNETVLGADIVEFVSTMNDKIYKATNENFNPSSEARNQNFAFVAMYWHGKQKGMTDEEAAKYGRVYGNVYTQFYYTKANVPWLLRGPIASTSLQYRRFAINTTGLLVNEFQKGNYSGVARYMAVMSMLGGIQASIGFSLASLLRSAYLGDKEGADDLTFKLRKWLKSEMGSDKAADIAMMGLPAAIGIDLSGSISIWQKPFGRNLYEKIGASVAGPTVNTILQMMTNLTAETAVPMSVAERGGRAILDSSPAAQQIIALWRLFSDDNIEYDARGRMKYKLDPMDAFLKVGAFRTVSESVWAMEYQRLRIIRNEVDKYADKAATFLAGGDVAAAQRTLREFNSLYPMASMNFEDIKTRVTNKKMSRTVPQLERRVDIESGVKARKIAASEEIGQ